MPAALWLDEFGSQVWSGFGELPYLVGSALAGLRTDGFGNLVAKASGGPHVIGRPQARAAWYPTERVRPVQVAVYWRYAKTGDIEGEPAAAARLVGIFRPGQEVTFPYNPLSDRNIILSTISIAADGTRSVRDIKDAHEELVIFQRETAAPTITEVRQFGNEHTRIALAADGYSSLAVKRRIRTADDEDMTVNVDVQEFVVTNPGDILPRMVYLDRPDSGTGTRTVWVRIAHSSGGNYGAESVAQAFTYADDSGAGSTSATAEGDPWGQVRFDA